MATTAAELVAEAKAGIEQVSPQDAFDEVRSGKATMLDIREPVEWEQHIDGAVQVPRGLLEWTADPTSSRHNAELDPSRRVIVNCRSGTRAALAVLTLEALGYRDVANLDGISGDGRGVAACCNRSRRPHQQPPPGRRRSHASLNHRV